MKKLISAIITLAILSSIFVYTTCTANDITVTLDGKTVSFDVQPQIVEGRTLVPLRKIFEEIGALVKWDGDTQTITARKSSKTVTLAVNSNEMTVDKGKTDENGSAVTETVTLDVPAQIIDGRTLVPARAISESFGLTVDWDSRTSLVSINSDSGEDDSWKENKETINLSDISDGQLSITKGGDYTLSGTLSGNITVNTEEKVKLRLAGADITSDTEPCIYFENADKAYISIEDGTENLLTVSSCDSGAVYSKDNLEIKGNGTLNIVSGSCHGIKASDNLTIEGGNINITANGDGIHVNDTFKMKDGSVKINAVCDGIESESIVNISGGKIDIKTSLEPSNSDDLNKTNEMQGFRKQFEETSAEFEKSAKGIKADWMMVVSGGDITVNSTDHAVHCASDIEITGGNFTLDSKYGKGISGHGNVTVDGKNTIIDVQNSTEGLESKNIITINDGTIRIIASDDGINGGGTQGMNFGGPGDNGGRPDNDGGQERLMRENGGKQGMNFGGPEDNGGRLNDKGVRQERPMRENGEGGMNFGTPDNNEGRANNYGGRQDRQMRENGISDGRLPEFDGKNPFGNGDMTPDFIPPENMDFGNMQPPENMNFMHGGMGGKNLKDVLIINGGDIEVRAGDDCLDANGNMVLNGGIIKASGPNGTITGVTAIFDPDGTISINEDAVLIAAAGSGGAPSLDISQNTITLYTDNTHSAGDMITIKSSAGKTLAEYPPVGSYRVVWIVSPDLTVGENYTITAGDETHMFTAEKNTTIGTAQNNSGGFGGRGQKDRSGLQM